MKLIKIPSSLGKLESGDGAELAPDAVIDELKNLYSSEEGFKVRFEVDAVQVVKSNIDETNKNIFDKIFSAKDNFIAIGGDHSISYSCIKAFAQNHENVGLIIFDAHPDSMPRFSVPTHENFLRTFIEEGVIKASNVILVGIRNSDPEELRFIHEKKINIFPMKEIGFEGKESICDDIMSLAKNFDSLYLSIDIDAVDPAFAPGTGYAEVGGLTSRELIYFIQRIKLIKNLKAIDLVEINPKLDRDKLTVKLGAKIVNELVTKAL